MYTMHIDGLMMYILDASYNIVLEVNFVERFLAEYSIFRTLMDFLSLRANLINCYNAIYDIGHTMYGDLYIPTRVLDLHKI